MKDLAGGAWFGACVLLIRNADRLPLWADITITAVGVLGIIGGVIWARVSYVKDAA